MTVVLAVVALAGLEAYLRFTIPPMREGTLFQYTLEGKRYKVMKAHAHMRVYGTPVRTNALGFRGPEVAPKRPGEFRIVVLGDSFTFGPGVAEEEIFTSLLQARLARTHPQAKVINLAVEGYNVLQYAAVLEEVGLGLDPDLVLVALFPVNDFEMDTYRNNRNVAEGHPPPPHWQESLYVYRAYLHRVESVAHKIASRILPAAPAKRPDEGWESNLAALKRIATVAEQRKIRMAVALLPHTKGFETQRAIFTRVDDYCAAEALRCLDLLAVFRAKGVRDGALVLNAVDAHGNGEYHRLVAELMTPFVSTLVAPRQPAAETL
jgi:hypothetical protein